MQQRSNTWQEIWLEDHLSGLQLNVGTNCMLQHDTACCKVVLQTFFSRHLKKEKKAEDKTNPHFITTAIQADSSFIWHTFLSSTLCPEDSFKPTRTYLDYLVSTFMLPVCCLPHSPPEPLSLFLPCAPVVKLN